MKSVYPSSRALHPISILPSWLRQAMMKIEPHSSAAVVARFANQQGTKYKQSTADR